MNVNFNPINPCGSPFSWESSEEAVYVSPTSLRRSQSWNGNPSRIEEKQAAFSEVRRSDTISSALDVSSSTTPSEGSLLLDFDQAFSEVSDPPSSPRDAPPSSRNG